MRRGSPWPLGATAAADGVNFAVASGGATGVEISVFDTTGEREMARHRLPSRQGDVWYGRLPNAGPGLVYGIRAHGDWVPRWGLRYNGAKLLLDPWARELVGAFAWRDEHYGFRPDAPTHPDGRDNAPWTLKARVVGDDGFDWGHDCPPRHAAEDLRLYELHVKGFTARHPEIPDALRGTYAGLASAPAIAHLRRLGVNAVTLLPVHEHLDEQRLVRLGLSNYWGYNTIGFFTPHRAYADAEARGDGRALRNSVRRMVQTLHAAGIEVILDVVYNHTAESGELGPHLSWRGLDNAAWYRLPAQDPSAYVNDTGCGNTVNTEHPRVLQFVLDSLRYWVREFHVDGFRFDLAATLGRRRTGFDPWHTFFQAVAQDPVLQSARLIAEPWDIGPGGYQLGQFPGAWLEWNDRYRDGVRAFWLGHGGTRGEMALRLCGSADRFRASHRPPAASINYVVSHDGFTLRDLVTYERRRNEANAEDNRDGHGHNLGWNAGVEGETRDPGVLARRARLQRALLGTLLLSQGTPMLAAGDELGHTQGGNNNPYCQDNPTTWIDWSKADTELLDFASRLIRLRAEWQPLAPHWYDDAVEADGKPPDLTWFGADGRPLLPDQWHDPTELFLAARVRRPVESPDGVDARPHGVAVSRVLLVALHGGRVERACCLPAGRWRLLVDTVEGRVMDEPGPTVEGGVPMDMPAHCLRVYVAAEGDDGDVERSGGA